METSVNKFGVSFDSSDGEELSVLFEKTPKITKILTYFLSGRMSKMSASKRGLSRFLHLTFSQIFHFKNLNTIYTAVSAEHKKLWAHWTAQFSAQKTNSAT